MQRVTRHLSQLTLGGVNLFVLEADGLTLIDTGHPGSADKIFAVLRKAGKNPEDIKHIILTHCHPDHAGSAAELKHRTGARVYAHAADARLLRQGQAGRPMTRTPGLVNWLVYQLFIKNAPQTIAPVVVDEVVQDGDTLPIAGGLQVIHTPGHSAGHIALLWPGEQVLLAGDSCANMLGLAYSTAYEDIRINQRSILKAATWAFDVAVFGHGNPVKGRANQQLAAKFSLNTLPHH